MGGYTLALSWAPEYCRTRRTSPVDRLQCGGGAGRFGFVLHGLWPDGRGRQWPQYCRSAKLLPESLIRQHLCMTPSVQLLQHEWAKHGTCITNDPARYFRAASRIYRAVRYPDMDGLSRQTINVERFKQSFAAANPGLAPDMLRVALNDRGWLREVQICFGQKFKLRRCPRADRGPGTRRIRIWRGG